MDAQIRHELTALYGDQAALDAAVTRTREKLGRAKVSGAEVLEHGYDGTRVQDMLTRFGPYTNEERAVLAARKLAPLTETELRRRIDHAKLWIGVPEEKSIGLTAVARFGGQYFNDPADRLEVEKWKRLRAVVRDKPKGKDATSSALKRWRNDVWTTSFIKYDVHALDEWEDGEYDSAVKCHMRFPPFYWREVEALCREHGWTKEHELVNAYDALEEKWIIRGDMASADDLLRDRLVRYDELAWREWLAGEDLADVLAFHDRLPLRYWVSVKKVTTERDVYLPEAYSLLEEEWPGIDPLA